MCKHLHLINKQVLLSTGSGTTQAFSPNDSICLAAWWSVPYFACVCLHTCVYAWLCMCVFAFWIICNLIPKDHQRLLRGHWCWGMFCEMVAILKCISFVLFMNVIRMWARKPGHQGTSEICCRLSQSGAGWTAQSAAAAASFLRHKSPCSHPPDPSLLHHRLEARFRHGLRGPLRGKKRRYWKIHYARIWA